MSPRAHQLTLPGSDPVTPATARGDIPSGLVYEADLISEEEEQTLAARIAIIDFEEVTMHGRTARRTVRHFGYRYIYGTGEAVSPAEPIPDWLLSLRDRCADLAAAPSDDLVEALVTRYPPGAGIGWHRDAPMFGSRVAGVSLLSPCRMRFQRGTGERRQVWSLDLAPRSGYVLGGASRWAWQHTIPPIRALRYSITFRTVRGRDATAG
ncbi:MAG: alpha-ketoglutarate-dependent dioxygenase AlkB [Candidatus Dormibacteria bacterium]